MKKMEEEEERGDEGSKEEEEEGEVFTQDKFINNHQLNKGHHTDLANFRAEKKKKSANILQQLSLITVATLHSHQGCVSSSLSTSLTTSVIV